MAYDLNDFVSNFDLNAARSAFNIDPKDPKRRFLFFSQIKQATFLVPQHAQEDGTLGIATLRNNKHQSLIPAFTDAEQYRKWIMPSDEPSPISYEHLKKLIVYSAKKLDGIVINPFDNGMLLLHNQINEIDIVVDGNQRDYIPRMGHITFHPPFAAPESFLETMTELFDFDSRIYRAWLMLSQAENEIMPRLTILADFDGERPDLYQKLLHVLRPFLKPGDRFELLKADYHLIQIANHTVEPFYTRDF